MLRLSLKILIGQVLLYLRAYATISFIVWSMQKAAALSCGLFSVS